MVPNFSACVQDVAARVPQDFELLAQRKGFKRFMSPALRRAVVARRAALDAREVALTGSLQVSYTRTGSLNCSNCPNVS